MKKALTVVVLVVTSTIAFAQGTVVFQNQTGLVMQGTWAGDTNPVPVPMNGGYVQLIAAAPGTALPNPFLPPSFLSLTAFLAANPGWALAVGADGNPAPATPIAHAPGVFWGGTQTLNNIAAGAYAEYVVIGWTGSYPSYESAIAAYLGGQREVRFGATATATTATGNPLSAPPGVPISLRSTFQGMTLNNECLGPYFWFTSQPISQTVLVGGTATFSVSFNACPLPSSTQWYFNGVSIPGAVGSSFQIPNAQLTNAGTYWVVMSNPAWVGCPCGQTSFVSAGATLSVLEPPSITFLPPYQTAYAGSTVDFRAGATGSPSPVCQWLFNGSAIPGANSAGLRLTSVSATQSGAYTLVVTNLVGTATSTPAMLNVIPHVEQRPVPALELLGQAGSILNLERADNLGSPSTWMALGRVTLTNSSGFYFDASTPLPARRFYWAWETGGSGVSPALSLKMVPAITLTGQVGRLVRVDYINQFGPTDAWVALSNLSLTVTSQLYFDVSAPGQPPRLYRLVQVPKRAIAGYA